VASAHRKLGRYTIEHEAATGGLGTVFRAHDEETGQVVALKVIRGMSIADVERFAREAQILSRLGHPGVVRYIEHGTSASGDAFLVMEWLDGEDLRDRLARFGLTRAESLTLGRRVAEALAAIHEQGLVHRDIKPGNLFLCGGAVDEVKIIDFGLARAADTSAGPTQTGVVVGTPAYMAPEQARGQRNIDARADIYSLGCVLFKALTGHSPFEGKDILAVLTRVLLEEAPRLREDCPAASEALEALIAAMLAKDPDARPKTAAAVAEALAAIAAQEAARGPEQEGEDPHTPPPASLRSPPLMVGEQRMVSMLLIGSDHEELTADVSVVWTPPAQPELEAVAREHGGQLDRLLDGTRVVAIVGAALATDQAARAARCALALRALLPRAPMVLATGRSEMTRRLPVGAAIDRAARMLRAPPARMGSGPAAIAIDEMTAALLDQRFEVHTDDDGMTLRGLRELESGTRTLLGKETPFVGREWELSSIDALFRECVDEPRALAVVVAAPAGMGKTRLRREVVRALVESDPGLSVWMARGDPLRAGSALQLLAQLIRDACGLREGGSLEEGRRRILRRTGLHVPPADATRVAQFLGEIVGTPFDGEGSLELRAARQDLRIMSDQMRRAWEDLLAAECAAHPVLIVIEDLHWGDPSTVRFLDDALKNLGRLPWMVLALTRPEVFEVFPRLWKERNVQEIRLTPLPRRASERLVREVLGEGVSAHTAAHLAARADGNAFYLEELIRAVAERAAADGPGSSLADAVPEALPETVLAMVQTRLEGLDADSRRVLRAASVFGTAFWPGGVAALLGAGTGPQPTEGWVDLLVAREVLVRRQTSRFPDDEEIAFRHTLLREGAYAMLTDRDRIAGHRLAGEWLEQRGERDTMLLAQHFEIGEEPARAGVFYLRAAEQALRGADLDAARAHAEHALTCGLAPDAQLECLAGLCEVYSWRAEWERSGEYGAEVRRLAPEGSVAWLKGVTAQQGAAFRLGRPQEFMEALFTLMGVDPAPDATGAVVQCLSIGILVTCLMAQFMFVEGILHRVDALVAPLGEHDAIARGWRHLSHACWEGGATGDLWAARAHVEAARSSFESANDLTHAQLTQTFLAGIQWNLGMFEEAERELRGMVVSRDDHLVALARQFYLTMTLIERGALDEARELATRRLEVARTKPQGVDVIREAEARWMLGEIALRAGDLDAAEREISAGLEALQLTPLVWELAATTLATVQIRQGRADEAVTLARGVLEAAAAHGGAGYRTGQVRLVYAESLYAAGEAGAGDAILAAARDDLLARAARIPDTDARGRYLTALPESARILALARERLGG